MTEQEAIKNVIAYVYMECENMPQQVVKALDILIAATKKQVSMEVENYEKGVDRYGYCRRCGNGYQLIGNDTPNYCYKCGQMMEWPKNE